MVLLRNAQLAGARARAKFFQNLPRRRRDEEEDDDHHDPDARGSGE